jgi:TetR/AcrR family tetracycline transcriptional repressor
VTNPSAPRGRPTGVGRVSAAMSFERIVETARDLVRTGGTEALSMRKLSAELGVAPTAIYWHVGDREKLLNAVLDAELADLPEVRANGTTPNARLRSVARAIRRQVQEAPHVQALALALDRSASVSFPGQVALAREVTAAGLHGEEAANAARAILFLVGGFAMLEGNFRKRPPGHRTTQELWAEVTADDIDPILMAAMGRPADTDALFTYALDNLIESVLARSKSQ